MDDISQLQTICDNSLQAVGYELVDLEYVREDRGWVLRIFIDHPLALAESEEDPPAETAAQDRDALTRAEVPKSKITHEDCEAASRHLGTVLDVEDVISNQYRLEVSSPGVQRPIRKERDFKRFIGHTVRVQTTEPLSGRKNFNGVLRSCEEGAISVEIDCHVHQIPLERIRKARLEVEL